MQLRLEADPAPARVAAAEDAINDVLATTIVGANVSHRYTHALVGFAASMSRQQAATLRTDPRVLRVEPDMITFISSNTALGDDPNVPESWGLRRISAPDGLAPTFNPCGSDGSGVTIAIIDSGITEHHTEFTGRIVAAENFVAGSNSPWDELGHGTHVAAIAAGATTGVARAASIISLRTQDADGWGTESTSIAALDWVTNPANIQTPATVNMSFGGTTYANNPIGIYLQALEAVDHRGIPIITAAGNASYPTLWQIPANSADTMAIGATGITDRPAVFSNFGPAIDLWAPGVNILSANWRHPDGGLKLDSGTSMASPMAAGVMALQLQRNPPSEITRVAGAAQFETLRQRLALIAASIEGKIHNWTSPIDVAVGGNGTIAGAANRLLQTCPASQSPGCDTPLVWNDTTASIVLGNGINPLPAGFACSQTVIHPSGIVALEVNAPAVLPELHPDGTFTNVAANIIIHDVATNQPVWTASHDWFSVDPTQRVIKRSVHATSKQGLRIEWYPIAANVTGGYGYAMTANVIDIHPGDLDGDGQVGGSDLLIILGEWGTCPTPACLGDLNHDGIIDGADLTLLLSFWGPAVRQAIPGFIWDCDHHPVPAAWHGDQLLDHNNRQYAPSPLVSPDHLVSANLNCQALGWDAPTVGFSISPDDPRLGACALVDGSCSTVTRSACMTNNGVFFGHGTTCDQLLFPPVNMAGLYSCPEGTITYGTGTNFDFEPVNDPRYTKAIWRQPLDPGLHSIDRLTVVGVAGAHAYSDTNRDSHVVMFGRPSLSTDLKVTLTFDDGSEPVSIVRRPGQGALFDKGRPLSSLFRFSLDVAYTGDDREITSIEIQAASEGLGPSEASVFKYVGRLIEADHPTPGAEYSADGGQTWHPILGADGRRYQLTLCITP